MLSQKFLYKFQNVETAEIFSDHNARNYVSNQFRKQKIPIICHVRYSILNNSQFKEKINTEVTES